MGYFFRPLFLRANHTAVGSESALEILRALAEHMDAPNNQYSLVGGKGKQIATWRWWGCFIHDPHYKEFINKLFVVYHDPLEKSDYEGSALWRLRYDPNRKNAFNKKYSEGFTLKDFNRAWAELIALVKSSKENWSTEEGFVKNLKQSLRFIMFSEYQDYEAY